MGSKSKTIQKRMKKRVDFLTMISLLNTLTNLI